MTENNMNENILIEEPVNKPSVGGNVVGIISMVLGISALLSLFWFLVPTVMIPGVLINAIPGLILSSIAMKKGERKFSKAGKITSLISVLLFGIGIVLVIVVYLFFGSIGIIGAVLESL